MALLDAIQLTLIYDRTQREQDSFASRIRHAALQYVTRSEGGRACYVSKQVSNQEFWIFLVHKDAQSHEHFLESTIGVGIMLPFLECPPRTYSFSEGSFEFLVNNANLHLSLYEFDPKPSPANMVKFEKALKDLWSPHAVIFAPRNDENAASFLGVTTETKSLLSAARNSSIDAPQYTVQSQVVCVDRFVLFNDSDIPKFPLPTTTAGILRVDPRLYGDVSFDESELGLTARAQGISFRPMEYIADADWFTRDEDDESYAVPYNKCLSITTVHYAQEYDDGDLRAISRDFAIQPGLLSLHWCKDKHNPRTVRIIAAWRQENNYKCLETLLAEKLSPRNDEFCTAREPEFTYFPMQEPPYWDDNSVVEPITFDFEMPLSKAAKAAFEWYLNKFLATMQPSDPDEPSIAQPFGPLWSARSSHQCLIAISWRGVPAREAWLRNFLAYPYDVAGYLVHAIYLSGAVVTGKTGTLYIVDHFRLKYESGEDEAADAGDEYEMEL